MPPRPVLPISALSSLYVRLGPGALSGHLFGDFCDQLLLAESIDAGVRMVSPSDRAGDSHGLDSMVITGAERFWGLSGCVGFHYKFSPSEAAPLSRRHRQEILLALDRAQNKHGRFDHIEQIYGKLAHVVVVTPEDFNVDQEEWLDQVRSSGDFKFQIHHWGQKELVSLILRHPHVGSSLYREIEEPLADPGIDLPLYCGRVIEQIRRHEVHQSWYQQLTLSDGRKADGALSAFVTGEERRLLCLLASFGNGKTTTLERLALQLATGYREHAEGTLPIFISMDCLREASSLEHSIIVYLREEYGLPFDVARLRELAGRIPLVYILDGFDEALQIGRRPAINQLVALIGVRAKVIVSSRTEHFTSAWEEIQTVFGAHRSWAIALDESRQIGPADAQTEIAYLEGFTKEMVDRYIHARVPDSAATLLRGIETKYNLEELSRRPVLLDMICDAGAALIEKLDSVSSAELYEGYTRQHVERDRAKGRIAGDIEDVLDAIGALALKLAGTKSRRLHFKEVETTLSVQSKDVVRSFLETAFLHRDAAGNFEFAHRSFVEFFAARALANLAQRGQCNAMTNRLIAMASQETIEFMRDYLLMPGRGGQRAAHSVASSPPVTTARFKEFLRRTRATCETFQDADGFAAVGWADAMAFARWSGGTLPTMALLTSHARSVWQPAADGSLRSVDDGLFSALPCGTSRRLMAADGFLILRGCWEWGVEGEATDWGWCPSPGPERAITTYSVRASVANTIPGCFRVL